MSDFEASNTEVWHVQFAAGDVRVMTLDELDEAFNEGRIDETTYVLKDGETKWSTLGSIAGLDEPEPVPMPAPRLYVPEPAAVQIAAAHAAAPVARPVARAAFVEPPISAQLPSMRPVVSEISDLELDAPQFRSSKRRGLKVAVAALLVIGGGAFAVTRFAPLALSTDTAAAAAPTQVPAPQAPQAPQAPEVSADIKAALANANLAKPIDTSTASGSRLSDDQRKALLDADKAREAKHKARVSAPSRPKAAKHPMGNPFHNGGSSGDPLNAKL